MTYFRSWCLAYHTFWHIMLFCSIQRIIYHDLSVIGVRMPSSSKNIFSFFVDMDSGGFIPWEQLVPSTRSLIDRGAVITIGETVGVSGMEQDKSHRQEDKIVSTVDTVRYSFLMSLLILHGTPVLLTGRLSSIFIRFIHQRFMYK